MELTLDKSYRIQMLCGLAIGCGKMGSEKKNY